MWSELIKYINCIHLFGKIAYKIIYIVLCNFKA